MLFWIILPAEFVQPEFATLNEQEIIQRFFIQPLDDPAVTLGIGDDAAIIAPPANHELVITTDAMVEGSHFTAETPPMDLGYKVMAVNLSDLAAMGAEPKWATLNITLTSLDESWLQAFSQGFLQCAKKYKVALIGGDLTKGTQVNVSVQLTGIVPTGAALTRGGARAEDKIFVTGTIGAAAKALQVLKVHHYAHEQLSAELHQALYRPQPRIELGMALRSLANCAIDISDGLLHELKLLCDASHVGARLQLDQLPCAELADPQTGLTGGEDYELLFTAPADRCEKIQQLSDELDCRISAIGEIVTGNAVEIRQQNRPVAAPEYSGFDHFEKR